MVKSRLKIDRVLIIWALLTAAWNLISSCVGNSGFCEVFYSALTIFWMVSLAPEIADAYIRRRLYAGGVLIVMLFALRMLRWNVIPENTFADRLCWYAYYVPFPIMPLLSLSLSLYIGLRWAEYPDYHENTLERLSF
ncbi:MAG: hypothetical protein IJT96_07385 [Lachnospiraceae bacterium]|nr:hypothetical protein [Lachnospiraceae bacterium]